MTRTNPLALVLVVAGLMAGCRPATPDRPTAGERDAGLAPGGESTVPGAPATSPAASAAAGAARATPGGGDASSPSPGPPPETVVARVGGEEITLRQVDEGIRGRLIALERDHVEAVHQARSAALSERIDAGLLVEESLRRGMPVDELQEAEAAARAAPVTDADLEAFYEENQARIQGSLDEVRERLRGYLQRSREAESRRAYLQELREAARVELLLPEPAFPRVAVAATGPARGPDDAPVTMIVFSEFQCPYCAQASPVLASLSEEYGDRLRVVFRDFPLPSHSLAQKASEAAHCAGLQGAFWAMHDRLFAHPRELDVASLKAHARALGLDGAAFDGCLDEGRTAKVVTDNRDAGREAGVTGTPAFFINGRYLSGARPAETFRALIDEELARAGS